MAFDKALLAHTSLSNIVHFYQILAEAALNPLEVAVITLLLHMVLEESVQSTQLLSKCRHVLQLSEGEVGLLENQVSILQGEVFTTEKPFRHSAP